MESSLVMFASQLQDGLRQSLRNSQIFDVGTNLVVGERMHLIMTSHDAMSAL